MIAGLFFFLVLAVILDLRTYRIPNALTMAGMAVGVIYQLYRAGPPGMFGAVKDLIGSILLLFPLYIVRCLGAGDIKLLSVVTIVLGWKQGMIISIYSLFAGAAMGIIKGSILFASRRKKSAGQRIWKCMKRHVMKNLGKGVAGHLQKNCIWFRQKERDHIEQIRTFNQLNEINQKDDKDQIGEIDQIERIDQIKGINHISYLKHMNRIKQMHHKNWTGEQGCVIHYSIAILIAFLIVRMS